MITKKILIIISLTTIVSAITYTLITRQETKKILESIPLISKSSITPTTTKTPQNKPITISAVDRNSVVENQDTSTSINEIEKLYDVLPVYIDNFKTKSGQTCTVNLYIGYEDPIGSLRLEIYGPNYNERNLSGQNALTFKECFTEIKNTFNLKKVDIKKLIFIYGNRQYIQNTASYWVKEFKLLD